MIDSPEHNEEDEALKQQIAVFIEQVTPLTTFPGKILKDVAVQVKADAEQLQAEFMRLTAENAVAKLSALQKTIVDEAVAEVQILGGDQARFDEGTEDYKEFDEQIAIINNALKTVPGFTV